MFYADKKQNKSQKFEFSSCESVPDGQKHESIGWLWSDSPLRLQ